MAAVSKDPARHLLVVGVNQRSARAALRDRLLTGEPDQAEFLARVRGAGVREAIVVSTCERFELLVVVDDPATAAEPLLERLADHAGLAAAELVPQGFRRQGVDALRHLFALAASLESQMVGEPQILGQIKQSHHLANQADMVGPTLESVLGAAYGAAKRVRSETPVAQRPVSIAASATLLARDVHGDLSRRNALLIGLGEMGEYMAGELGDAGLGSLVVMHESLARSEAAARRLGCHFRAWGELDAALAEADVVISAMGTGRYAIAAPQVERALKQRRREPMFFIDAAVPGDVDPAVGRIDGAFVYDLEDLERVARKGKATRQAATDAAWRILEEELAGFLRRHAERAATPAVTALRHRFETLRAEILANGKLSAEDATRLLVNRLLHDPSEVLREAAAEEASRTEVGEPALDRTLRRLFRIGEDGDRPGTKNDRSETAAGRARRQGE